MAKKRRKKRNRGIASKILFVFELLILIILLAGVFLYAKFAGKWSVTKDNDFKMENVGYNPAVIQAEEYTEARKEYQLIALVGLDSREGSLDRANSDTMMIACIDHDKKEVRLVSIYRDTLLRVGEDSEGNGKYRKANYAYNAGGSEQFLTMINQNLDLMVTDYVAVDFNAVAEVVDILGGVEIELTHDEIVHMNNYCVETSEVTGKDYKKIDPDDEGVHTLNGVQAVSYARIRYTAGNDFKRAARQRLLITKLVDKVKSNPGKIDDIMDEVFPMVKTNVPADEVLSMGLSMISYDMGETTGFPFSHYMLDVEINGLEKPLDCVAPITLESNVQELHQWMFGVEDYQISDDLQAYSDRIVKLTGYGEEYVEKAHNAAEQALPDAGSEADGM